jgi:hypothetical protein
MRRAFFGRNPDRVVWKANFAADRSEICFLPLVPQAAEERKSELRLNPERQNRKYLPGALS